MSSGSSPSPPPASGPEGPATRGSAGHAPPAWKSLLALLSLVLSLMIWLGGLLDSLERPFVGDALSQRQLELTALAAEAVPEPLRTNLFGSAPRAELQRELERRSRDGTLPAPAALRLELLLLDGKDRAAQAAALQELERSVDQPRRPLLAALRQGQSLRPSQLQPLLAPWQANTMLSQLSCEQLGEASERCPAALSSRRLLLQWLVVSLLPLPLLLLGVLLLLRLLWQLWRGRLPTAPPLLGPPLDAVEVTLLIAGGFVLLGEVLLPQLLQGRLAALLASLSLQGPLEQGVQVLLLYLLLTVAPLTILTAMLTGRGAPPAGGWLQWHWRPLPSALARAIGTVLMVLPLVALSGWLIEHLWRDPGGSNPLLDLVLTSSDPRALACFAFTAVVLAPLFEELLFRGVLLPVLARRWGAAVAVLASALIFALAHLSLSELAPLFVLGVGLGWLRWRSGRLGASVLMHALWNALTFLNLLVLAD
ncbi:MAG: lysostaphin resistance A-like protein [Cyanobium sp.]